MTVRRCKSLSASSSYRGVHVTYPNRRHGTHGTVVEIGPKGESGMGKITVGQMEPFLVANPFHTGAATMSQHMCEHDQRFQQQQFKTTHAPDVQRIDKDVQAVFRTDKNWSQLHTNHTYDLVVKRIFEHSFGLSHSNIR